MMMTIDHDIDNPRYDQNSVPICEPSEDKIWPDIRSGISKLELFLLFPRMSMLRFSCFFLCYYDLKVKMMMMLIGRMTKGERPGGFRDGSRFKLSLILRPATQLCSALQHTLLQPHCTQHNAALHTLHYWFLHCCIVLHLTAHGKLDITAPWVGFAA